MPSKPRKKKSVVPEPVQVEGFIRADEVTEESVTYLCHPWILHSSLTMLVGLPGVGKSTFASYIIAQSGRAVVLPGKEESLGMSAIPRWRTNGVSLSSVLIARGKDYRFPRDATRFKKVMIDHGAKLLLMDPVDSYCEDGFNENHGTEVRDYLESLAWIANEAKAAIVAIRHPGKDPGNLLPGSRQWRAVPRAVLVLSELLGEQDAYTCSHFKPAVGAKSPPTRYFLRHTGDGKPFRFEWGQQVTKSTQMLHEEAPDKSVRGKVLEACLLLAHMFNQEDDPSVNELVNQCRMLGIGEHARDAAKRILGIRSRPSGVGQTWVMERSFPEWPDWLQSLLTK